MTRISIAAAVLIGTLPSCAQNAPEGPDLTPDEEQALLDQLSDAEGKADGYGLSRYRAGFLNAVVSGWHCRGIGTDLNDADCEQWSLIAGSHDDDFPYNKAPAWDSVIFHIDGDSYHGTERGYLTINGERIEYDGPVVRESDGASVQFQIDLPIALVKKNDRYLGTNIPYGKLAAAGMDWSSFELSRKSTRLTPRAKVGDQPYDLFGIYGMMESGDLINYKWPGYAAAYDYVTVVNVDPRGAGQTSPEYQSYSYTSFEAYPVAAPCSAWDVFCRVLSWHLKNTASATQTIASGKLASGNPRGVMRPKKGEEGCPRNYSSCSGFEVLAEHTVDMSPANIRRQLIRTTDGVGVNVFGLREVFVKD